MNTKRHDKDFCGPCKKSQLAHSLSRERRSIGEKKPFMRDRNSDGPYEGRAERKVTGSLSMEEASLSSSTPIPRPHNNGHHVATKAKHPKYWRKSRYSVAVGKWDKMRGYWAPLNISLGSNLSCLVHVILLHGQTVTFLDPSIVETLVVIERESSHFSLFLEILNVSAPIALLFHSLGITRLSPRRRGTTKAPTPLDSDGSCESPRRVKSGAPR